MKYNSLYDLYCAIQRGEVSSKNFLIIDNDCINMYESYTPDGVEIESDDSEVLYDGGDPRAELIDLLCALGINVESA